MSVIAHPVLAAEPVAVPSGQEVTLNEVLIDENPGAPWLRFRFVAPGIARGGAEVDHETAARDMDALCDSFAIPYVAQYQLDVSRIVISFSDRDVPFGAADAEATQFFEVYSIEDSRCIWEEF